jgi:hypothetical protein
MAFIGHGNVVVLLHIESPNALIASFLCAFVSTMDWQFFTYRLVSSSSERKKFMARRLWSCKNYLNDLVADLLDVGRARAVISPNDNPRRKKYNKKCPLDALDANGANKLRGDGAYRGRGRGNRGGGGKHAQNTCRIDFDMPSHELFLPRNFTTIEREVSATSTTSNAIVSSTARS